MKKIGVGEYDTADGFHARRISRFIFLHHAKTLVPKLLPSLAKAIESLPVETFELPADGAGYEWLAEGIHRAERFRTAIVPWQSRWHLTDDWIFQELHYALCRVSGNLRAAERVLGAWKYFDLEPVGSFSPVYQPSTTGFRLILAKPLPPLFAFEARWYPQLEFRADISRWLKKQFQKKMTAYLDAAEKQMKAAGLVKTPKKRSRRGGDATQHFDWLVRFQVEWWEQPRIAAEYGDLDITTVADALKSTAQLLGLTLRSTRTQE